MREPAEILPEEIAQFLHAETHDLRDGAWRGFLARHNRLLLRVAYTVARNREDAMDAYTAVLERLREDDGHRLRAYRPDGRSKFTTWLVVVSRRICVDFLRRRYGRYVPAPQRDGADDRSSRLALLDLLGTDVDPAAMADEHGAAPDGPLRLRELSATLNGALEELSNDDRLLLKLRFEDDLSASAIARLVGSPTPFHVYRRLNALLAELRAHLSSRGVENSQP
jgi:RNA polymerase sigma factor (sigma-70 family)